MGVQLDHYNTGQKQAYVVAGTTIGLVLSIGTYVARIFAKALKGNKLRSEDWWMLAGLVLSIFEAVNLFYELSVGLGHNVEDVSEENLRRFLISLWTIQRLQPPTLFCVKTSIILFYVRLFEMHKFKMFALAIWVYTLLWTIGAWFATLFECHPISFYWNKHQEGGTCVKNPLITIGLTSGVISCIGDIIIFSLPFPVLSKLKLNSRKKIGLMAIFTLGLFVVCISFIRWVALLGTEGNITSSQVEAGVWTYLEAAIAITCANLPVMAPLFRRWVGSGSSAEASASYYNHRDRSFAGQQPNLSSKGRRTVPDFLDLEDSPTGSQVELASTAHVRAARESYQAPPGEIHVRTELDVKYH